MASSTCSLYIPRAVCRFVVLSPALNTEITLVFLMEFGRLVLTSWRLSLKVPCPLSPPIFNHNSSAGIIPSCHVNPGQALPCKVSLY